MLKPSIEDTRLLKKHQTFDYLEKLKTESNYLGTRVSAVLTDCGKILSEGYCYDLALTLVPDDSTFVVHAEIMTLMRNKHKYTINTILNVSSVPCLECAKAIIVSPLKYVHIFGNYLGSWKDQQKQAVSLMEDHGVRVVDHFRDELETLFLWILKEYPNQLIQENNCLNIYVPNKTISKVLGTLKEGRSRMEIYPKYVLTIYNNVNHYHITIHTRV